MEKIWILSLMGSLLWVAAVMLALAGIGDCVLSALRQSRGWIASFVSGLCAVVALGGWLNFLHEIRSGVLIAIVAIGIALGVRKLMREGAPRFPHYRDKAKVSPWVTFLIVCCVALVAVRIIATVHRVNYEPVDDLNEYLVFPHQMLQQHYFAANPFSERRLINSVGPTYFVQALIVSVLPLTHLQMADETIGMIFLMVCLVSLAARWKVPTWATCAAVLVSFGAVQSTFNLSFSVLPGALLTAMIVFAYEEKLWKSWGLGVLLGATAGVICGLKTTYLPHAALVVLGLLLVRRAEGGWGEKLRGCAGGLIGFFAVLGPWMIAMRETSETFLFPIFGQGIHYPHYYHLEKAVWKAHSIQDMENMLWLLPVLGLLFLVMRKQRNSNATRIAAVFVGMTTLATVLLSIATAGDSVMRYNMPCVLPALVVAFLLFVRQWDFEARDAARIGCVYTGALLLALVFVMGTQVVQAEAIPLRQFGVLRRDFPAAFRPASLPDARMQHEYEAMESYIPADQKVLAVLTAPYYLDYANHVIYLSELTAAASPKPGWPIYGSGDDLAKYLRGQSIRYLAYSYADNVRVSDIQLQAILESDWTTTIVRNEISLDLEARRQFKELAATHKHIYDDGQVYLLDLDRPR